MPAVCPGRCSAQRSLDVLKILRAHDPAITLISVGGLTDSDDARERLGAGADLVQAYTGFVYGGPSGPGGPGSRPP